jgi:hypothetical protein
MPDSKTTYWLGRLSNLDLLWCLRFSSMPRRAVRRLEARNVRRELREAVHAYCAFRAFAPGEQTLTAKWAATFRQSELLLFDQTRRARWLIEAKDLDHPIAVLAIGWRREPERRQTHEHRGDPQ